MLIYTIQNHSRAAKPTEQKGCFEYLQNVEI